MDTVPQDSNSRAGFTLAELLVVILIIGVLAGLLFSISSGVFQKGDRDRVISELQAVSVALEAYRNRFGDYPDASSPRELFDSLDGKRGPRGQLLTPAFPPFLEAGQFSLSSEENPELLDPWGTPYEYVFIEGDLQTKSSAYLLFSKGPDGSSSVDGESGESVDDDNLRYDD